MNAASERRLLILDDDALVGLLVESVARLAGVTTCLTREADEFYAAAADWGPTHVVLDLTMPGASGEEVLAELAARGCRARIIITSGAVLKQVCCQMGRGITCGSIILEVAIHPSQ